MRWIVRAALDLRLLVIVGAAIFLAAGVRTAMRSPIDVFPEFAPPLVEIQTEAPGLSTLEVESRVTLPIETVLHGVPFQKTLRSKSVLGLSSVVMVFDEGASLFEVRSQGPGGILLGNLIAYYLRGTLAVTISASHLLGPRFEKARPEFLKIFASLNIREG